MKRSIDTQAETVAQSYIKRVKSVMRDLDALAGYVGWKAASLVVLLELSETDLWSVQMALLDELASARAEAEAGA